MTQGNSNYEADLTVWWQYEITTANDTLVITDETLTSEQVSIPTGVYLVADDNSSEPSEVDAFSYLLDEIESQLSTTLTNNGSGHTYSFEVADPTGSSDYTNGGVKLVRSDSTDFTLDFSDSNFTLHKGIFGYPDHLSVDQSSSSGVYTGETTQWGRWQAPPDHYAHDLSLDETPHTLSSGGNQQTRGTLEGVPKFSRRFNWFNLPAAVVKSYRARDATLASNASLNQDDIHNAFQDAYAASARRCVITYGVDAGPNIDPWAETIHEVAYMPSNQPFSSFWQYLEGEERYTLEMMMEIIYQSDAAIIDPYLG